jgi:hypothetical protein
MARRFRKTLELRFMAASLSLAILLFLNDHPRRQIMTRTTYPALPTGRIAPEGCFLSTSHSPTQVRIDSPALQVMTDLTRLPAASICVRRRPRCRRPPDHLRRLFGAHLCRVEGGDRGKLAA